MYWDIQVEKNVSDKTPEIPFPKGMWSSRKPLKVKRELEKIPLPAVVFVKRQVDVGADRQ